MPVDPHIRERARTNLLGEGYGKFDLVEELFPAAWLLSAKPRQIRRRIAEELQLPVDAVPYKTFMSWLARYRSRRCGGPLAPMPAGPLVDPACPRADSSTAGGGDWRTFVASDPRMTNTPSLPLMTFPDYATDSPNPSDT